ncbi:MAG: class I SAM-dependent rRNA methyltransferase [Deltaproteobacteria bacterium]|nr:class I SAM-dependent rRNA methyltransferase [Deltaproteobacteria bacterium]
MRTRRYQVRKDTLAVVDRGHPWIFREQLSSAAGVFADGDWLKLVDGTNKVIAHGIYEASGAIAIRIMRRGPQPVDAVFIKAQLAAAIAKRTALASTTDGIRLVNGESDGIPAVVIDRFGDDLVIASYSAGADAIARYAGRVLGATAGDIVGPARSITLRPARRRQRGVASELPQRRVLRGTPSEIARFVEDGANYAVDLAEGHKTGAYLDLRGLRRGLGSWTDGTVAVNPLRDARVLNLFAYTGMLARAAEHAGAQSITSVDASERALAFAAEYHVDDRERHQFVTADVFEWLPALSESEQFDLVIVDPPSMTSNKTQVPGALNAYRKLYKAAARHVRPSGAIVAACCTSRIERAEFHHAVSEALGHRFKKTRELTPEVDHPVGFPQADYLKIAWWRRTV